jgi:Replication-relaxation
VVNFKNKLSMASFAKFIRPEKPTPGVTTGRDLDIIEAILRYRFSPTSQLVRLVGGNEDVTLRRLRRLWANGLINRWAFPGIRTHSEFHYYLDSREPVDLLMAHGRIKEPHPAMLEEIRNNRERDYAAAAVRGQHMQLGFLQHSLMISRMHFMLEMACRQSVASANLDAWSQGGPLAGNKVQVPKIKSSRRGNDYFWEESDETERLPVEPDALFTLRFAGGHEGSRQAHFLYEADRGTMNTTDMLKKLRAYYHFIKKQQRHREAFGIHPIRAVLVETTNETRARRLMELVHHPLLCGREKRAGLFWFTISGIFTDADRNASKHPDRPSPAYLESPATLFTSIWALPDGSLHRLSDAENS